jgi:5-methylcytosine-specific restriction protein B
MITKVNINSAITKINTEGIIQDDYYIYANGRLYPPHLVISYADSIANSTSFATDFTTGVLSNTDKTLLETNDFRLVAKGFESNDFSLSIYNWLRHSYHMPGQCYGHSCPDRYRNLKLVEFIPEHDSSASYIMIMDFMEVVNIGIYPVVIAHREEQVLIFALGIGPDNLYRPWPDASSYQTVSQYLVSQALTTSGAGPYLDYLYFASHGINTSVPDFGIDAEWLRDKWNDMIDIYETTLIP